MITLINQCIIIFNIIFIIIYIAYLFKIKAFKMNAEPLTHQPLFKAALIIPIVSFLLLGLIVWTGHSIQIDAEGFNNFLAISKLPLAALSLCIPFGVVVNNIHRTIQTDKQIKEAEKKNTIDGFYSHRKNTIEIIENIEFSNAYFLGSKHQLEFRNSYSCYKTLYPYASQSNVNLTPSQAFIVKLEGLWLQMADLIHKPEWKGQLHYYTHLNKIENCLFNIHMAYMLKDIGNEKISARTFTTNDGTSYEFRTLFSSEKDFKYTLSAYWHAYLTLMELLEHTFPIDFKEKTWQMVEYTLGVEERFITWGSSFTINATIPQIVKL